jgi:hypothetical protein
MSKSKRYLKLVRVGAGRDSVLVEKKRRGGARHILLLLVHNAHPITALQVHHLVHGKVALELKGKKLEEAVIVAGSEMGVS